MRRRFQAGRNRPAVSNNQFSRDLDWLVDRWSESSPEVRLQLVLAKIRHEEKESEQQNRQVG